MFARLTDIIAITCRERDSAGSRGENAAAFYVIIEMKEEEPKEGKI